MATYIALFRGINVLGKKVLPMRALVEELEALKCQDVRTYIQSGNAVFKYSGGKTAVLGDAIAKRIEKRRGFRPEVLILAASELHKAVASNPYPEAAAEPKTLHVFFLASRPKSPDVEAMNAAKTRTERFHLVGKFFYLHTPDGFGRSKLAAKVEKSLGAAATARNWRTVLKLAELVDAT